MAKLFATNEEGVFGYDFFVYTGYIDDAWMSIVLKKQGHLQYELISFLPCDLYQQRVTQLSGRIERCLRNAFRNYRQRHMSKSGDNNLIITQTLHSEEIQDGRRIEDNGIYAMFYPFLSLKRNEKPSIAPKDVNNLRELVLYMLITQDINYGQTSTTSKTRK